MKRTAVLLIIAILLAACGGEQLTVDDSAAQTSEAELTINDEPIVLTPKEEPEPEPKLEKEIFPFEYEYNDHWDGIFITAYISDNPDVIIPQEIDGVPVVGIGREAFKDANISSVIIPEGILLIIRSAFENNPDLTEIVLPKSLTKIWDNIFSGCTSLIRIDILNSEFSAGYNNFGGNENLIITFRNQIFTYEDIRKFNYVVIKDIEPDPDMVAAWEENGEWDVSELALAFEVRGKVDLHRVTIINLDGTVRRIDFPKDEAPSWSWGDDYESFYKAYQEWREKFILNSVSNNSILATERFDSIPDDIVESVRTLGVFTLDASYDDIPDAARHNTYLVVGSGENRRLIDIGNGVFIEAASFDDVVNELAKRIREWRWEQEQKHLEN
jgi:hypothetical protein